MTRREPLDRDRVLRAAVEVADADGLDALSMRRLGRELGVEAMSLYNHVAGKDDVLDGIVDYVIGEMHVPQPGDEWEAAIRARAQSARAVFARHPWAMGLLESRYTNSSPRRLAYYDAVLGSMLEAGFDIATAIRGFSIVDSYIFGFILQEQSLAFSDDDGLEEVGEDLLQQMADAYPNLTAATEYAMHHGYEFGTEFGLGLDLIVDGLRRLRDENTPNA